MARWVILLLLIPGCGSGPPITPEEREYKRVDFIETQFKPAVDACYAGGGHIVYKGPYTVRMRHILDNHEWLRLRRTEITSFSCAK